MQLQPEAQGIHALDPAAVPAEKSCQNHRCRDQSHDQRKRAKGQQQHFEDQADNFKDPEPGKITQKRGAAQGILLPAAYLQDHRTQTQKQKQLHCHGRSSKQQDFHTQTSSHNEVL